MACYIIDVCCPYNVNMATRKIESSAIWISIFPTFSRGPVDELLGQESDIQEDRQAKLFYRLAEEKRQHGPSKIDPRALSA